MSTIDFNTQYNSSYIARFKAMKPLILSNPAIREYCLEVRKLTGDISNECIVVATLFLYSTLKPSILKDIDNKNGPSVINSTYLNDDSSFFIEDENGRLEIQFTKDFNKLYFMSSGMVLGFIGKIDDKNIFQCNDVIFPKPFDMKESSLTNSDKILLISNCLVNNKNYERLRVIADSIDKSVTEAIVIGDIYSSNSDEDPKFDLFNKLIRSLGIRINIVPGLNDPTTRMIPQAPLHKLYFEKDVETSGKINRLENPAYEKILGSNFIVLSHHLTDDLIKYCKDNTDNNLENNSENKCEILKQLIKIRYLLPNAPDTISCVPFSNVDPFVINNCDIIITGGKNKSMINDYNGIKLIVIPDFDITGIVLIYNMKTGDIEEIECERF